MSWPAPIRKKPQADSPQAINKFPRQTGWQMPEFIKDHATGAKTSTVNGINPKNCASVIPHSWPYEKTGDEAEGKDENRYIGELHDGQILSCLSSALLLGHESSSIRL
jgi:hypothetical protein